MRNDDKPFSFSTQVSRPQESKKASLEKPCFTTRKGQYVGHCYCESTRTTAANITRSVLNPNGKEWGNQTPNGHCHSQCYTNCRHIKHCLRFGLYSYVYSHIPHQSALSSSSPASLSYDYNYYYTADKLVIIIVPSHSIITEKQPYSIEHPQQPTNILFTTTYIIHWNIESAPYWY